MVERAEKKRIRDKEKDLTDNRTKFNKMKECGREGRG